MLRYMDIHVYFLVPPILVLAALYRPLFGRRTALKLLWLATMATVWTTPWDNFIISQMGWSYPPGSIIGKLWLVPIEEHMFFVLQPILLVLLHEVFTHRRLLPFDMPARTTIQVKAAVELAAGLRVVGHTKEGRAESEDDKQGTDGVVDTVDSGKTATAQTLSRRPLAAMAWMLLMAIGAGLVVEAHGLQRLVLAFGPDSRVKLDLGWPAHTGLGLGMSAFYLGWSLVWISPVIALLTYLGGRVTKEGWWAWGVGTAWLVWVDTIAIRNGAWRISPETSLGWHVWQDLPIEEFIFFLLTCHLVILSTSLISHLHALLVLSPSLPVCPPANPVQHISLLARVVMHPPEIDARILHGLVEAEETLRKGSKSFEAAKLAFGREIRIGLVAIYAWCRVTDDLIDDLVPSSGTSHTQVKRATLDRIRKHLIAAYEAYPAQSLESIIGTIPGMTASQKSAFHLFASLIPRLVPVQPFLELCQGYETDMQFHNRPIKLEDMSNVDGDLTDHLPIKTTADLLRYADNVAGSVASAICYLAWSTLTVSSDPAHALRPVRNHPSASHSSGGDKDHSHPGTRAWIIEMSREMGRALQLVNVSRDIAKDALISRLYIPLSSFPTASAVLDVLYPSSARPPSYNPYALYSEPLLDLADTLRQASEGAIEHLPRTARGGTRAMSASYFEIAGAIRLRGGQVDARGVKVSKWRRAWAAARAFWR